MKILIYGAGAIGSIYAARLHCPENEVSILARGTRLADLRQHGLILRHAITGDEMFCQTPIVTELTPKDDYDLVIVAVRLNQVATVLPTLATNRKVPVVLFIAHRQQRSSLALCRSGTALLDPVALHHLSLTSSCPKADNLTGGGLSLGPHKAAFEREVTLMKKVIILLVALVATTVIGQDKSTVTVKSGEVNDGVIILTVRQADPVRQGKASFVLQCNKGMHECAIPPPGNYLMVRLPENYGMYDCANVELYPASGDPETSQKIGEYCLIDK